MFLHIIALHDAFLLGEHAEAVQFVAAQSVVLQHGADQVFCAGSIIGCAGLCLRVQACLHLLGSALHVVCLFGHGLLDHGVAETVVDL